MISVLDVKKSFDKTSVLKGVTTSFEQGKTNLIIGQSGSGKTVFLKCLIGLFKPDSGTISFDGKIHANMSDQERKKWRSKMGVVFQGSALFDSMTVIENIMFPLQMYSDLNKNQTRERAQEVLLRVNLSGAENKFPAEISGGMQKRVAIARAIVNYPKYLFCDEPNSGLDPKTALVIDALIHDITKEYNTTTIINTHDMNSVLEIGEKIVFLKDGVKAWEGNSQEIIHTENEYVEDFVYSSKLFKKLKKSLQ